MEYEKKVPVIGTMLKINEKGRLSINDHEIFRYYPTGSDLQPSGNTYCFKVPLKVI